VPASSGCCGALLAVLTALVAGLVVSNWFYLHEKAARQEAVTAGKEAQAIVQFLTEDVLFQATPEQNSREKQITLEQALSAATRRLDQDAEIHRQPKVEATLRIAIGRTYQLLGTFPRPKGICGGHLTGVVGSWDRQIW